MSLKVQIHEAETHILVKAIGQYSLADLHDLFDRVKKENENRANQRVILDITEVAGAIPILDMLVLGEHCARFWKQAFKVAIVSPVGGAHPVLRDCRTEQRSTNSSCSESRRRY